MRLDYVVTLKNDYTREEIIALTKSVDEAIFSHEALKIPFNSISYWLRDEYDSRILTRKRVCRI